MDIGFGSVKQMNPPQTAGVAGGVSASGTAASGTSAPKVSLSEGSAPKAATGWMAHAVGSSELAKVTGEERIDEAKLRRDDDLGKLARKAFDLKKAAAALPRLNLGTVRPSTVATARRAAETLRAMAESSYETSRTIIDNMVDSPEERAEKAAREAERQAKESDENTRLEGRAEKEFQNARLLDEIASNRIAAERS